MSDEMLLEDDPARYWEMMFKDLARENSRLMERCGELEDLLRWRDAWGEPPTEHGNYLVHRYAFYGDSAIMTLHWNGSWPMRAISHWRPIGPLPKESE
jgi:hypothetical protein